MKKCKACGSEFKQFQTTQKACSIKCAQVLAKQSIEKKQAKDLRERRQKLKTLSELKKELQVIFNRFIRLRDKGQPCISCQRHHKGQYHAGHFLSVGSRPNLRYDEANCHLQCAPCNNHLSGNITNYRINLVGKLGLDVVERLESDHEPRNYTREDILELKKVYRQKIKELEQNG